MLRIDSTRHDNVSFNLLTEKVYIVGRKQGDITFPDDQSVSRVHAELKVEHSQGNITEPVLTPALSITDLGSKFGTFATDSNIESKNPMDPRETLTLNIGDTFRFGLQWNEYKIVYTPLVVTTSSLKKITPEFKQAITKLGGHLVPEWNAHVTHVVMDSVTLTIKAVCGLLAAKSIVTPAYVHDLLASFEEKKDQPNCEEYIPPITEKEIATVQPSGLKSNSARTILFVGKTFIFCAHKFYKKMKTAVEAGGGQAKLLLDPTVINVTSKDSIIVGLASDIATCESKPSLKEKIDTYKSTGKRFIINSEIGLAAVHNSVEKFCNPKYSMMNSVLTSLISQTQGSSSGESIQLVPATQDMETTSSREHENTRSVVHDTIVEVEDDEEDFPLNHSTKSNSTRAGKKRQAEPSGSGSSAKKRSAPDELARPDLKRLKDVPKSTTPYSPSSSRSTRSSSKIQSEAESSRALTNLFNLSSDDDDDEVVSVPETQQSERVAEEHSMIESLSQPKVNVVDIRKLQSMENKEEVFRVPASPPLMEESEPSQRRGAVRNRGTDFIETVRSSVMNSKTVPCETVVVNNPIVPEATSPRGRRVSPRSAKEDIPTPAKAGTSRKRPRDDEETVLSEETKKMNMNDVIKHEVEQKEEENFVIAPPPILKPLINKKPFCRQLSFNCGDGYEAVKNFKVFKKVIPVCLARKASEIANGSGHSARSSRSRNTTIDLSGVPSIRGKSTSTVKLNVRQYSPGKGAYYFGPEGGDGCDIPPTPTPGPSTRMLPPPVAASPEPEFEEVAEVDTSPEKDQPVSTRATRSGRKRVAEPSPPLAPKDPPLKRTSPRKRGAAAPRVRSPSPPPIPVPVEQDEDDDDDDQWTFKR